MRKGLGAALPGLEPLWGWGHPTDPEKLKPGRRSDVLRTAGAGTQGAGEHLVLGPGSGPAWVHLVSKELKQHARSVTPVFWPPCLVSPASSRLKAPPLPTAAPLGYVPPACLGPAPPLPGAVLGSTRSPQGPVAWPPGGWAPCHAGRQRLGKQRPVGRKQPWQCLLPAGYLVF